MVIAPNAITIFLARTEEQLIDYFRALGATSPQSAIPMNMDKLKEYLETPEVLFTPLEKYKFVRKIPSGKYYLDLETVEQSNRTFRAVIFALFLIFAIIGLISTLLLTFGFLTNS